MRFDNIAMAANTPGGFQAGVNDIVQALMGAKRQQAQQAFQEAQAAREQGNLDRSYGAQQAQQLSSNAFREREIASTEARTRNDAIQNGQKFTGGMMDRAGAVGQYFMDKFIPDAKAAGGRNVNAVTPAQQMSHDLAVRKGDEEWAMTRTGMNSDGTVNKTKKVVRTTPGEFGGSTPVLGADGQPVWDDANVKLPATDADWRTYQGHLDARRNPQSKTDAMSQARGEVIPPQRQASGTPGMGTAVAQSLAPNTGVTNGLSQNEGPETQAHTIAESLMPPMMRNPIDYAAEDARLQSTNPQYRQLRANPGFNWKGAVDKAMRAQQPR